MSEKNSYAPLISKSGGEVTSLHSNEKYAGYARLVKDVGAKLATQAKRKDLEFEFKVLDSQENNAWCLPGGKISINVGLIEKMDTEEVLDESLRRFSLEEKIAAVLSHEIVHADARHTGRALEFRLFLIGIIKATQIFFVYRLVTRSYDAKIAEARKTAQQSFNPNDETRNKDALSQVRNLTLERNAKAKTYGYLFDALSSWLINGITLCSSRSHELESDRFGMRIDPRCLQSRSSRIYRYFTPGCDLAPALHGEAPRTCKFLF
jgi:predicted Zn-dependent protease